MTPDEEADTLTDRRVNEDDNVPARAAYIDENWGEREYDRFLTETYYGGA